MDVLVVSPCLSFISCTFPHESTVSDLIDLFSPGKGVACLDFYVKKNGRLSGGEERLHAGAVYRLEPRLCGGKGGFGSMLRALGAQIEKTTNREACRDLSGRRLRDVNHEKEMAEWLKKQTDRDAEKEQRRLEKIQRKLAEPKRGFIDAEFDQQCHDLSERLDNSVLKGMQASSSNLVQAEDRPCRKRPAAKASAKSAAHSKKNCFWTGIEDMDSTDEESDESEAEGFSSSPSSSSASSSSVAGPSNISQPVAVSTSTARDQEKFKSRDRPCSSSSSSSSGSSSSSACSAPCSPPPSQGSREENEEDRKTDQEEEHSEMAQEEEHAETAQEKEEEHVEVAKEEEHAEAAQEKEEEHAEVAQEKEEEHAEVAQEKEEEHAEAAQEEEEEHGETAQEEEHAEAAQEKEEEHAEAAQEKEEEHAEVAQEEERGETAQEEEHAEAAQEEEHGEMTQNEIENTQSVSSRRNAEKDKPVESVDPQKVQLEDADTPLDLLSVSRAEELEAVGLERLKAELMKRGMKCGGTLQERAARLFSVRGLGAGQIDPALLAKPSKGKKK